MCSTLPTRRYTRTWLALLTGQKDEGEREPGHGQAQGPALYGGSAVVARGAHPPVGDARALRGVVGIRHFLPCGSRSAGALRPAPAALAQPNRTAAWPRGQLGDRVVVPTHAGGWYPFVR